MTQTTITLKMGPDEYAQFRRFLVDHRACLTSRLGKATDRQERHETGLDLNKIETLIKGI